MAFIHELFQLLLLLLHLGYFVSQACVDIFQFLCLFEFHLDISLQCFGWTYHLRYWSFALFLFSTGFFLFFPLLFQLYFSLFYQLIQLAFCLYLFPKFVLKFFCPFLRLFALIFQLLYFILILFDSFHFLFLLFVQFGDHIALVFVFFHHDLVLDLQSWNLLLQFLVLLCDAGYISLQFFFLYC